MSEDEMFDLPIAKNWAEADRVRLGRNLADLRTAAGLSQVALADAMRNAGLDHWRQTTVSRVERGAQTINMGEWKALEAIVGRGIMRGTDFEESMRKSGQRMMDGVVRIKLQRADEALIESMAQMEAALKQVRQLRYVFDKKFAGEHPEFSGDDDGVDQEAR